MLNDVIIKVRVLFNIGLENPVAYAWSLYKVIDCSQSDILQKSWVSVFTLEGLYSECSPIISLSFIFVCQFLPSTRNWIYNWFVL